MAVVLFTCANIIIIRYVLGVRVTTRIGYLGTNGSSRSSSHLNYHFCMSEVNPPLVK